MLEPVIQEFWEWQEGSLQQGVSGIDDDAARFVPYDRLQSYLSKETIFELLKALYKHSGDVHTLQELAADVVSKKCIRSFAILVLIDNGKLISQFTKHHDDLQDKKLPFTSEQPPAHFPGGPEVYQQFREAQHQFCVRPMKNLNFTTSAATILPIISMEQLDSGVSADVFKIELYQECNAISFPEGAVSNATGSESKNVYALKRFKPSEKASFHREVNAFDWLRSVPNVIGYYGHFTVEGPGGPQDDPCSYNILLEYADCGNLEKFWSNPEHAVGPVSATAFWAFWEQLFCLATAVDGLHRIQPTSPENHELTLRGFHHDIRPSNVLVSSNPIKAASGFPYRFLLGDLGLVEMVRTQNPAVTTEDPRATLIYSAPEIYRREWQQRWPLQKGQAADIWSLGSIFSEAFTWSTMGYAGLDRYREERKTQTEDQSPRFHDGANVLPAVTAQHETCAEAARNGDKLAPEIVGLLGKMLHPAPGKRPNASDLVAMIRQMLRTTTPASIPDESPGMREPPAPFKSDHESQLAEGSAYLQRRATLATNEHIQTVAVTHQPTLARSPARSRTMTLTNGVDRVIVRQAADDATQKPLVDVSSSTVTQDPPPPEISVQRVEDWRENKKKGFVYRIQELDNLTQLRNRDIVFIIDDSKSMMSHWKEVIRLLSLLAYLIKKYDDNGMDFVFMSEGTFYNERDSKPIITHLQRHAANCTTDTINAALSLHQIFDRYLKSYHSGKPSTSIKSVRRIIANIFDRRKTDACKPCSYFILTDGIWQPQCKVSKPIYRLLKELRDAGEHQVGISFIQFGNSSKGTRRLQFLDNGMSDKYGVSDVIDYEPFNGNILKMLLGPISPWWDGANTPDNPETWLDE